MMMSIRQMKIENGYLVVASSGEEEKLYSFKTEKETLEAVKKLLPRLTTPSKMIQSPPPPPPLPEEVDL